jgi:hypothetical protein
MPDPAGSIDEVIGRLTAYSMKPTAKAAVWVISRRCTGA